jgi:hypothetical protein
MLIARLEGEGEGLRKRLSMQFSVEEEKWMLEQKLIETEAELKVHETIAREKKSVAAPTTSESVYDPERNIPYPPPPPDPGDSMRIPRSSPQGNEQKFEAENS